MEGSDSREGSHSSVAFPDDAPDPDDDDTLLLIDIEVYVGEFTPATSDHKEGNSTWLLEAPLLFRGEGRRAFSRTLRIEDLLLVPCPEEGYQYGTDSVYVGLPALLRSFLNKHLTVYHNQRVAFNDGRLLPDPDMWWRIVHPTEHLAMSVPGDPSDKFSVCIGHDVAEILKRTRTACRIVALVQMSLCLEKSTRGPPEGDDLPMVCIDVLYGVLQEVVVDCKRPMLAWDPALKN